MADNRSAAAPAQPLDAIAPEHRADYLSIERLVRAGIPDGFAFLACGDQAYRDRLVALLSAHMAPARTVTMATGERALYDLIDAMGRLPGDGPVLVFGLGDWVRAGAGDTRLHSLNYARGKIQEAARGMVVFWLHSDMLARIPVAAPDFWSWRRAALDFTRRPSVDAPPKLVQSRIDIASDKAAEDRDARIADIEAYLAMRDKLGRADANLLLESGQIRNGRSDWAGALADFERAATVFAEMKDSHGVAQARLGTAAILARTGKPDAALEMLRLRVLPIFDRLGDIRARAITMGQIADVLQGRGDLDEALRIRREEELPVYDRLGDIQSRAVTMDQIADILQVRDDLDEALRIRREEVLPVCDRLGDIRGRAVTMGKIADVLQVRGDLDDALRIWHEEVLPVFDRLGDIREHAVTMGRIADVLQLRGDLDEALRIRREEVLPVFDRLGDIRSRAVTMGQIADVLQDRGDLDDALRIRRDEEIPIYRRLGDRRSLGITLMQVAELLDRRGETADADAARREATALRSAP